MGIGDDLFRPEVKTIFRGSLDVKAGDGRNLFNVGDVTLNGPTTLVGGANNDSLLLYATINEEFTANLGDGHDFFNSNATSSTILVIDLGAKADTANLFSANLAGITLDGGEDDDSLSHHTSNPEGQETFLNFEHIDND